VVFHKYMNLPSFYRHPIDSRDLNVYCVSVWQGFAFAPLREVEKKCVVASRTSKTVAVPFAH
jgi:hypothetical protein